MKMVGTVSLNVVTSQTTLSKSDFSCYEHRASVNKAFYT